MFDIQKQMLRDLKKTICDCVMCLNDDQKNVELEKDNPYETKAIKSLFPLKYPQVC